MSASRSITDTYSPLSVHGRSYLYDVKAAGFGCGECTGFVLINCLDEAARDQDPIHAMIHASAVNHGGRSDGIATPNGDAHRMLLRAAHESADLDPTETPVALPLATPLRRVPSPMCWG